MKKFGPLFSSGGVQYPNAPPGTGVVFTGRTPPVKFALSGPKWTAIVLAGFFGAITGNLFYSKFILYKNPPNPPRDMNEKPPEKHPHAPEEEE